LQCHSSHTDSLKIRSLRLQDSIVCSRLLGWLFSPAWDAVQPTKLVRCKSEWVLTRCRRGARPYSVANGEGGAGGSGFWTGIADIPPAVPCLTVCNGMLGVCPAGCVGGKAAKPGFARTPSPSVQLGAIGWSPHCPSRGRRSPRLHRHKGQTVI
jgi:hypothetical protein